LGIEHAARLRRWERTCDRSAGREGAGSEARRVWSRRRGSDADADDDADDDIEGGSSNVRPAIVRRHRRGLDAENVLGFDKSTAIPPGKAEVLPSLSPNVESNASSALKPTNPSPFSSARALITPILSSMPVTPANST
jgi:hypothetical protein